jgi:asparagine synthase (glutamine-hydrolysing)
MLEFLCLMWPASDAVGQRQAVRLTRAVARREDLALSWEGHGARAWTRKAPNVRARPLAEGRGVVIGEVFPDRADGPGGRDRRPAEVFQALQDTAWGAYVAILADGTGAPAIFRDPSGGLDCLTWKHGAVTLIASDLDASLLALAPADLAIDWDAIGDLLRNPGLVAERLPLRGVKGLGPGVMIDQGEQRRLWRPSTFLAPRRSPGAKRPDPSRPDRQAAALRACIDDCVAAWALRHGPVLAEVSGGLDSAIVAASLRAAGADVRACANFHPPQAQADERIFARAVARQNGWGLTSLAKPSILFGLEDLARGAQSARPGFNRVDHDYDRDCAQLARHLGAKAILGGQGGDAVLFRDAAPAIAADALRTMGLGALSPSVLEPLAWWSGKSVWRLARQALVQGLWPRTIAVPVSDTILSPALRASARDARHPWLRDVAAAPPAKQMQVLTIANCQLFQGDCARKAAAALIHPLLSQPVVELCLSISTYDLTLGRGDRALARWAFRDRLPRAVIDRRTKGETSTFYGHGLADSLEALTPFLLDGRLVQQGLLDPEQLAARLDVDYLTRTGEVMDLLVAAMLEAWVRRWEGVIADPRSQRSTQGRSRSRRAS